MERRGDKSRRGEVERRGKVKRGEEKKGEEKRGSLNLKTQGQSSQIKVPVKG